MRITNRKGPNEKYTHTGHTYQLIQSCQINIFYAWTLDLSLWLVLNQKNHVKPLLAWKQPSFRPGKIGSSSRLCAILFANGARDFLWEYDCGHEWHCYPACQSRTRGHGRHGQEISGQIWQELHVKKKVATNIVRRENNQNFILRYLFYTNIFYSASDGFLEWRKF